MLSRIKKYIDNFFFKDQLIDKKFYYILFNIRRIFLRRESLYKIESLANHGESILKTLKANSHFVSIGPKIIDKEPIIKDLNLESLNLYQFLNATINVYSSCILYKNRLVVDSNYKEERYNEGYILKHGYKRAILKNYYTENLEEGFFLGGNGAWNWYHFLLEIAPKLIFKDDILPCKHLFLSQDVLKYESMLTIIERLVSKEYTISYLSPNINYKVAKLYYINHISYLPFNMLHDNTFNVEHFYLHKDILLDFREKILAKENIEDEYYPKKIFLERKNQRVAENQGELIEEFKKIGFESISFEELSLTEQIKYFHNAEFILGTTGAAWANLLFANSTLKGICFMQDNLKEFSGYSNLANMGGVNLIYYFYKSVGKVGEHHKSGYKLDIDRIKEYYFKLSNENT